MASDMFSTLDPSPEGRERRGATFICGLFAQALLIGIAALLGVIFPQELPVAARQYMLTWLPPLPTLTQPAPKPPRVMARVVVPKLKSPVVPKLPTPVLAEVVVPKIRPTIPPVTVSVLRPPAPPPAFPQPTPAPPAPKVQIEVHTGEFGGAAQPVTTKRPAEQVQTGGFGSPQGFPGQAQGNSAGNVPKLGSFGLPDGPGVGNGTGGAHGIQGVVASAGFGNGIAGPGYGRGGDRTRVTMGGFEKVAQVSQAPTKNLHVSQPVDFQPVEILSKPTPVYTEEARHLGIQGEVTLSVVFEANGAIKVLGVVKSLGHGLDQAAQQAATLIRFKPALRDGKPADFPATLRIEFRLADQST